MKSEKLRYMSCFYIIIIGLIVCVFVSCVSYSKTIKESYLELEKYTIKRFETEYGMMSFVDEGNGEAIIISHGIFGGYDQGYKNLYDIFENDYRKIAISRFGYPGSNLPSEPTPSNQAKIFLELMNELEIDKAFLLAASAGGTSGIRFALDYPERLKGLILLSSDVPSTPMTKKEIGRTGPPKFILNDKIMLFSIRNFKGVFYSMFGSKNVNDEVLNDLLPVKPRRKGIIADTEITNIDMAINYYDYPVENIKIPVLVIHAKDDPMTKYSNTELFLRRVNAETMIFPDGGHLIVGHNLTEGIKEFIVKYSR